MTAYEVPFKTHEDRRMYWPDPRDPRLWHYRCPNCGATGRGEGHHRVVRNLAAHCRSQHKGA